MKENTELKDSLDKVMKLEYRNHKGCLIRVTRSGYEWNGNLYPSIRTLDEAIQASWKSISDSIHKNGKQI